MTEIASNVNEKNKNTFLTHLNIYIKLGAGADGAGAASLYSSGYRKMMLLRLRNTATTFIMV
jgi:hypothetical protein